MHSIFKKAGLVFSIVLATHTVSAQETVMASTSKKTIKGKLIDAKTKEVLIGGTVSTLDKKVNTATDVEGHFEMEIADSVSEIVISYLGYDTDTVSILGKNEIKVALKESKENNAKTLNTIDVISRKKSTDITLTGAIKLEKIGAGELMKAACCNLSESFETTPSVDVGFTDAVSGYKQVQMLGLAGAYTTFTRENIPDIRGLASITGLAFTPGTFVESMQLSKGTGSVVNGYEGTAGQINVEWLKPFSDKASKWLINGYQSSQGRSEGNLVLNHKFNKKLSTSVLLHGRGDWLKVDENKDNFLDAPLGNVFVGSNRWFYFDDNGLEIQGGFKVVNLSTIGGQKNYTKNTEQIAGKPWGYQNQTDRLEAWAKIGKVNVRKPYQSMGLQLAGTAHNQESMYGAKNYDAQQNSFYANYIFQSIINNTNHIIKGGASFIYDDYKEKFGAKTFNRKEIVPGVFGEYAFNYLTKFNMVAGLRADYHNQFGAFLTPRLHLRYAPTENTALRASIGRAQRTANYLAENMGLMASSRSFQINGSAIENAGNTYAFKPEVAWNMGLNATQKFRLNYRDGSFSVDYYYTNFTNQVVVDIEDYRRVNFYNLNGKSYSHSFQAQLDYEIMRHFDVRLAYRFYDVKTQFENELLSKPLVASHRAFLNLAYSTKNKWKFDFTTHWTGAKRVPQHYSDHMGHVHGSDFSKSFWLMNAQINKSFWEEKMEVYAGVENIGNVMQHPMISDAQNPFGNKFDASLIWGSGMGRNIYVGFRLKL